MEERDMAKYIELNKMVKNFQLPIVNGLVGYPEGEVTSAGLKYRINDKAFLMKMSLEGFDEEPEMIPFLRYELVKEN